MYICKSACSASVDTKVKFAQQRVHFILLQMRLIRGNAFLSNNLSLCLCLAPRRREMFFSSLATSLLAMSRHRQPGPLCQCKYKRCNEQSTSETTTTATANSYFHLHSNQSQCPLCPAPGTTKSAWQILSPGHVP